MSVAVKGLAAFRVAAACAAETDAAGVHAVAASVALRIVAEARVAAVPAALLPLGGNGTVGVPAAEAFAVVACVVAIALAADRLCAGLGVQDAAADRAQKQLHG